MSEDIVDSIKRKILVLKIKPNYQILGEINFEMRKLGLKMPDLPNIENHTDLNDFITNILGLINILDLRNLKVINIKDMGILDNDNENDNEKNIENMKSYDGDGYSTTSSKEESNADEDCENQSNIDSVDNQETFDYESDLSEDDGEFSD